MLPLRRLFEPSAGWLEFLRWVVVRCPHAGAIRSRPRDPSFDRRHQNEALERCMGSSVFFEPRATICDISRPCQHYASGASQAKREPSMSVKGAVEGSREGKPPPSMHQFGEKGPRIISDISGALDTVPCAAGR